ncbi:GNAT family N-acetyltransferase [Nocardioides bigeumensis]|uniref:GNAT family N-acetyltransferase n=1 Tax=Nocardioides bigeumensis TaxID=433657 RepID=A0ABN2Y0U3_9ACTN
MTVELRVVDPSDEAVLRDWWEVGHAAEAERPHSPWPKWAQSRVALPAHNPERELTLVTAYDGGSPVGASMFSLPTKDNDHLAFVELWVLPQRRREGIATLLSRDLDARAAAAGRSTLLAEAKGLPGTVIPGERFALAQGYQVANEEQEKDLDLTTAPSTWAPLDDEVAEHAAAYRIETFDTVYPDHLIDGIARLLSSFYSQVPLGETDLRDSEWTPERLRAHEARLVEIRRSVISAVAVSDDGEVAAFSDIRVSHLAPETAEVGVTIVAPEHRGHRLGYAVKLAGHRRVLADFPDCVRATTCNADTNTAMNLVNERMGYVPTERLLELQKRLD